MWNLLSGGLTLLGYVPYIRSIIRGNTHPSTISWWIWSSVGLLLLSTYYSLGSQAALGLAIGALTGQIVIALLSLRYGTTGITKLDLFCLLGAVAAGLLWWITASPFLPHVLILVIDFCGWLPTFRKVLNKPRSEDLFAWLVWTIAASFSLLDPAHWTFNDLLYPVYIVITDGLLALFLLRIRVGK